MRTAPRAVAARRAIVAVCLVAPALSACEDRARGEAGADGGAEDGPANEGEGEATPPPGGGAGGVVPGEGEGEGDGEGAGDTGAPRPAPECTQDTQCRPADHCDPVSRACRPRAGSCGPCTVDAGCTGDGSVCLDHASGGRHCAALCLSDFGCEPCFRCEAVLADGRKHCVPRSGSCEQACPCEDDGQCGPGRVCSERTHDCTDGCVEDGQCPGGAGQVCDRGRCRAPCEGPADCPDGAECQDGRCQVPGGCITSADCEAGHWCDTALHACVAGCQRDNDCGAASLECEDGQCVEAGCERHHECGFGQVCRAPECQAAPPEHCAACDPQAEGGCGGAPNLCATFQDEEGADLGSFCLIACDEADPGGRCPQGWQCQDVEVAEGDARRLCVRACYRPPVSM